MKWPAWVKIITTIFSLLILISSLVFMGLVINRLKSYSSNPPARNLNTQTTNPLPSDVPLSAIEAALPKAPDGFRWTDCFNAEVELLQPDGWFKLEENNKDGKACYLTQEKIKGTSQFSTGLSVQKIASVSATFKVGPVQFAKNFVTVLAKDSANKASEIEQVDKGDYTNFKRTLTATDFKAKYVAIANTKSDTVYILWFESPPQDWDNAFNKYGDVMLSNLQILRQL